MTTRNFNYTGRMLIPQECIDGRLIKMASGPPGLEVDFDWMQAEKLATIPDDANVFVELPEYTIFPLKFMIVNSALFDVNIMLTFPDVGFGIAIKAFPKVSFKPVETSELVILYTDTVPDTSFDTAKYPVSPSVQNLMSSGAMSSEACTDCPSGKYSTAVGAIFSVTCENCPAGKYLSLTGAAGARTHVRWWASRLFG